MEPGSTFLPLPRSSGYWGLLEPRLGLQTVLIIAPPRMFGIDDRTLGRMQPYTIFEELYGALHAARVDITQQTCRICMRLCPGPELAGCIEKGGATVRF